MIDPNSQFFAILTATGEAKQANADALGIPWKLTELGVGDANGTDPIPDRSQTKLINEKRRRPLNKLSIDPANPNVLIAEQIIPADEGGWWIREIGLYDADGALVAVANCAPSYKPLMSQGSGRTQVVRMNFIVSSAGNVVLKIDPSVVLATRQYVDESTTDAINKQDVKQSVLVATTGPIQLAGAQAIDGIAVPLGARVLVKDQAQSKDNGIYLTADIWKRTTDADSSAKVTPGLMVAVEQGTLSADTLWLLATDGVITLGTTPLTFKSLTQGLAPINSPALVNPTANTPPQFTKDKTLATTEYVQKALGNYSGGRDEPGTGLTLPLSDIGGFVSLTAGGSQTVALPLLENVPDGGTVTIHNPTGQNKIVTINGGNRISPDGQIYTIITMRPGDTGSFTKQAGVWRMHGTAALKYSGQFAASVGPFGHEMTPCGLIKQWGSFTAGTAPSTFTFPIAFTKGVFSVQVSASVAANIGSATLTGIPITAVNNGVGVYVYAIGE